VFTKNDFGHASARRPKSFGQLSSAQLFFSKFATLALMVQQNYN
jgi:hypothetical protein